MLLKDYETCSSTLRLLGPELKSDKAWKHYAGVQVGDPATALPYCLFLW